VPASAPVPRGTHLKSEALSLAPSLRNDLREPALYDAPAGASVPDSTSPSAVGSVAAAGRAPALRFCIKCGFKFAEPVQRFCPECGFRLPETGPVVNAAVQTPVPLVELAKSTSAERLAPTAPPLSIKSFSPLSATTNLSPNTSAKTYLSSSTLVSPTRGVGVPGNAGALQRGSKGSFCQVCRSICLPSSTYKCVCGHFKTHHIPYEERESEREGAGGVWTELDQ
jgi:hypothetical protein